MNETTDMSGNAQLLAMPSIELAALYLQKREALSDEERAAILAVLKDATENGCFVVKAEEAPDIDRKRLEAQIANSRAIRMSMEEFNRLSRKLSQDLKRGLGFIDFP